MGLAIGIGGHAGDHRDVAGIQQGKQHRRIHGGHITHQPVGAIPVGAGLNQRTIAATQAHGPRPQTIQAIHDLFVDATDQHHLHHIHGVGRGDPQAVAELGFDVEAAEPVVDLGATAVHHHRLHPHRGQQHQIAIHGIAQVFAHHRRPAVLHHHPATSKALDVGQRLAQHRDPQGVGSTGGGRAGDGWIVTQD